MPRIVYMSGFSGLRTLFALFVLCAMTAITSQAQTFTTLVNFDGRNGASPWYMPLAQGSDGNFYGTTEFGGGRSCGPSGCGTLFKMKPGGEIQSFHLISADGSFPVAGLTLASDGNFYGVTTAGGVNNAGTVFKITEAGKETVLYNFCAQADCVDGKSPRGRLLKGTDGNFYGTTGFGGMYDSGTVFRISLHGVLTTIYSFCSQNDCADGGLPNTGLVEGVNGHFFGTTFQGGPAGVGTVFEIGAGGALTTLHGFEEIDGANPSGWLVQTSDGAFHGTTASGGSKEAGTVFTIDTKGALTTVYQFCTQPNCADGSSPYAGLVLGTDGNLYGTTFQGGDGNDGTVFMITPQGALTTLMAFDGSNGYAPITGLTQSTGGSFYGTTSYGGDQNCKRCGTVFNLDTGLSPFVGFVDSFGRIGESIGILGQDFTGATAVTVNGTPASFTAVSDTFIKAKVPAGATTGYVTVATPTGTLTSNVPFHVIP